VGELPGTDNERPQKPLNTEEVAEWMGLAVGTVRAMCERGDIPATKFAGRWYIRPQELDRLLAGEPR
jgi:excisionase family DNA binding protein